VRGQITVFILIGIVLVVMVGGLLMITNREDAPVVSSGLDTQVVQYVTSCLQTALEDGLLRLGRQGFQLNLLPTDCRSVLCPAHQQPADLHMYNLSAVSIPYVIRLADQDAGGAFHTESATAKYPWEDFPKSSAGFATHPFFSSVTLPPLYSQGTNVSVQEQLERHIESLRPFQQFPPRCNSYNTTPTLVGSNELTQRFICVSRVACADNQSFRIGISRKIRIF